MALSLDKSGPPLLRMGHALAFCNYLFKWGAPFDQYLARQGLPVLCDDPDHFAPLQNSWGFFDYAAAQHDPLLGWQVGRHIGEHNLNHALLSRLETAPTLLNAIQRFVGMAKIEASDLEIGIYERPSDILLYTHYTGKRDEPGYHVSQAYQIGVLIGVVRHFMGRQWLPDQISIEAGTEARGIEEYFPSPQILSQQRMGFIAIPKATLSCSLRRAKDGDMAAENPLTVPRFDFLGTLRELIKSYLPDGYPSAHFTARLMDVSERTLARRLHASGYTYQALIDEVRFDEATQLLNQTGINIADIARAVGFEDQGNFTRMFRRLGGLTPREFANAGKIDQTAGQ